MMKRHSTAAFALRIVMDWYSWLRPLFIGGAVFGVMTLWGNLGTRRSAIRRAAEGRQIGMSPLPTLILMVGMGGIATLAIWAYFNRHGGPAALVVGLACSAATLLFIGFLMPAHAVEWDDLSLTGPTSYTPWPFGPSRGTIRFDDIAALGMDWAGSWFVEDAAGQRIRWSYLYAGFPVLMEAIVSARPDLFPAEQLA